MSSRPPLGRLAALGATVLAAGACAGPPSTAGTATDDARAASLAEAQRSISQEALAGLAGRNCPELPTAADLEGLPDAPLACLGTGPARAPSTGDGRPTVVNLWASWCLPCVEEMPLLQRTADRAGAAARFVGIDTEDERDSAAALLEATGVRYAAYDDPDGAVRDAVRAVGLPVTLVYDVRGREVARKVGQADAAWLEEALGRAGVRLGPAG